MVLLDLKQSKLKLGTRRSRRRRQRTRTTLRGKNLWPVTGRSWIALGPHLVTEGKTYVTGHSAMSSSPRSCSFVQGTAKSTRKKSQKVKINSQIWMSLVSSASRDFVVVEKLRNKRVITWRPICRRKVNWFSWRWGMAEGSGVLPREGF